MVNLVNFIKVSGFSGPSISPSTRDIIERSNCVVDVSSIELLNNEEATGLIRAFRFCSNENSRIILNDLLKQFIEAGNKILIKETVDSLITLKGFTTEDRVGFENLYPTIKNNFPDVVNEYENLFLHIYIEDCIKRPREFSEAEYENYLKCIHVLESESDKAACSIDKSSQDLLTICQFADIHFGKFHSAGKDAFKDEFKGPTQDLARFLKYDLKITPDLYCCCGDIASDKKDDFKYFHQFADELPVKTGDIYDNLVIVPGNHDNFWTDGFTTDRLRSFSDEFCSHRIMNPFGLIENDQLITVNTDDCPMSCAIFENKKLIVLLSISCMYSGEMESVFVEMFNKIGCDLRSLKESDIGDKIRFEHGYLDGKYCRLIEPLIEKVKKEIGDENYCKYSKVAIIHHQFDAFYNDEKVTIEGNTFRKILYNNGFLAVLHGHVHMINRIHSHPAYVKAIPCPALSGRGNSSKNGFNLIEIKDNSIWSCTTYFFSDGTFEMNQKEILINKGEII